jgi:DNA-directed RNA polymerase subunit H (RpoH/RPB5)
MVATSLRSTHGERSQERQYIGKGSKTSAPSKERNMQRIERKFECVHRTVHGDGTNIRRILKTCDAMLKDRGYTNRHKVDDVLAAIVNAWPVIAGKKDNEETIEIYINEEDKVGVKFARTILEKSKATDLIVISFEGPTSFTRKECDGYNIQFMLAKELCFNVSKHELVPKHVVVDRPPGKLTQVQLPRILVTDPIVQYYNWPIGTIIRIERCYAGHEPVIYYRCVGSLSN